MPEPSASALIIATCLSMLRTFAIISLVRWPVTAFVLCCAIAMQFAGKPYQATTRDQQTTNAQRSNTTASQNDQKATGHADHPDNGTPEWYATPEWWLVGVGILTFLTIAYQSRETARAAKAAANSVQAINRQTKHIAR